MYINRIIIETVERDASPEKPPEFSDEFDYNQPILEQENAYFEKLDSRRTNQQLPYPNAVDVNYLTAADFVNCHYMIQRSIKKTPTPKSQYAGYQVK